MLYGGAMLGLGAGLERVFSFLSVTLAARISGPQTFGGYSVTLATAGTIAAYAGAGIGITAVRFSGDYRPEVPGYSQFVRALAIIALLSATAAALFMFLGAGPIARLLLHNESLVVVLRVAALSAGAIVLLESCRGLLVGQQKFNGLLLISLVSGVGWIVALPLAARIGAAPMVGVQGGVALLAVVVCVVFSRRLGVTPKQSTTRIQPLEVRRVFAFGLIQFSAFASISVASWWIASLVVRADPSLTQMGFYSVANQWRGLAAIAPTLLAQVVYSSLTNKSSAAYGGPETVLLSTTLITAMLVTLAAGFAILILPWVVPLVYGGHFGAAELAASLLLGTAIIHMSGQPAAQRLSIVTLRAAGLINVIWAVVLVGLGIMLIPNHGAAGAAIAFFAAHATSNLLVVIFLHREATLPDGYVPTISIVTIGAVLIAVLAYWRTHDEARAVSLTLWMALGWLTTLAAVVLIGVKYSGFSHSAPVLGGQAQTFPQLSET
jgi:O-antigen/teichoic acid export membrane protein